MSKHTKIFFLKKKKHKAAYATVLSEKDQSNIYLHNNQDTVCNKHLNLLPMKQKIVNKTITTAQTDRISKKYIGACLHDCTYHNVYYGIVQYCLDKYHIWTDCIVFCHFIGPD